VIVLCGPPACGKSALGRKLISVVGGKFVRTDDLGRRRYERLPELVEGATVVEGTFYLPSHWARFLRIGGDLFVVLVTCNVETALRRNRERGESIPPRAIIGIHRQFRVPPAVDLVLNTDLLDLEGALKALLTSLSRRNYKYKVNENA